MLVKKTLLQKEYLRSVNKWKLQPADYDREKLQERLAKLAGGVAVLYIGAASEMEMKEKKDRVDDALSATRAAVEEGIVPGGGVAYIRAIEDLKKLKGANEDENTGIAIIARAIEEPLRMIVENAGVEGSIVVQKVKDGKDDFGYNARTDKFENLHKSGVIDPTKVAHVALENAASVAGMFLTTECVIVDKKEENPAPMGGGRGYGRNGWHDVKICGKNVADHYIFIMKCCSFQGSNFFICSAPIYIFYWQLWERISKSRCTRFTHFARTSLKSKGKTEIVLPRIAAGFATCFFTFRLLSGYPNLPCNALRNPSHVIPQDVNWNNYT